MIPCWPNCDTIKDTIPAIFRDQYRNTTAILDAMEIKVHTPIFSPTAITDFIVAIYKSTNIFKALLAISPAGHIIFASLYIADK